MRRNVLGGLLIFMLLAPMFGSVGATTTVEIYEESFTFKIRLFENGDANITLISVWLRPKDKIQEQIEYYLNQTNGSVEDAIKLAEEQQLAYYVQIIEQIGIDVNNATVKVYGIPNGDNITVVFNAIAVGMAKYYSYGDFWEIIIDPTRGLIGASYPDTGYPYWVIMHNEFVIHLPPDATLLSYPLPYKKTFNQSLFEVVPTITDDTVTVASTIKLEPYLSLEGFGSLFDEYNDFSITYQTPYKGEETFQKRATHEYVTLTVFPDGKTELKMREVYLNPQDEIDDMKSLVASYGVDNFKSLMISEYAQRFVGMGAVIYNASAYVEGLNETGPLVIGLSYLLENYTKLENGTYVYIFNPTMGLSSLETIRALAEYNYTFTTEVVLPDNGEFVSVPEPVSRELHGNYFTLNVTQSGNKITITANTFIRYGASRQDIMNLLEGYDQLEVRYTLDVQKGTESNLSTTQIAGIVGAFVLIGLAIFIWKKH
ncbi:hypothetical protein E3E35_09075 [Thermococcus sp. GR7]|uniref:hypothetical protein n=1 Tax=unclassified Thermococcus TaxID=2627626 RepID=UPI0014303988|nr:MULTISPECIES: hypothetical protein [unclassified Thermococcus]NJE47545.1 hypothetical protein [Thermococcus sp. GR7]NJE79522.1 hypothetical protein [Thermococcus sp. GR4]NJF22499.1 hypothetical protein [Thermococcus sp. GR5]